MLRVLRRASAHRNATQRNTRRVNASKVVRHCGWVRMRVCAYECVCVRAYACVCVRMRVCGCVCVCVRAYACVWVRMRVCGCVCVCVRAYARTQRETRSPLGIQTIIDERQATPPPHRMYTAATESTEHSTTPTPTQSHRQSTAHHSTSQHSTSQHITAHHLTSPHITSQHVTSPHSRAQQRGGDGEGGPQHLPGS